MKYPDGIIFYVEATFTDVPQLDGVYQLLTFVASDKYEYVIKYLS